MKLSRKLTLGFVSIALLVAVVGYIAVGASQKALQKTIGEQSAALAGKMLEHIDKSIYHRIEQLQVYSKDITTEDELIKSNQQFYELDNIQEYIDEKDREWTAAPKETVTPFMQELIDNELSKEIREEFELKEFYKAKYGYEVFGEVFVTNKYGANAAQTGKTTDYYQADERWWQNAKKDGLYVVDVEYDESADVYSLALCMRIDGVSGNFLGVMKVVLNIRDIIDVLKGLEAGGYERKEYGHHVHEEEYETIEFKLLTKDGEIIYSTEGSEFFDDIPPKLLSVLRETKGGTGYFIAEGDKPGEGEELFAHAHSKGYKDFGGLGWILIVEHETKEIFASVAKLRKRILAASVTITILAVLLGLFISRSISEPVTKLAATAAEIGRGKLDTRLEVRSKDEIGQLADSFNKMAEDLQTTTTSIDNLNREIAERKKAEGYLEASNRELKDFVYIASHDLREPMRKISSFGELLKDSLEDSLADNDQENLEFMIDGANRMTAMIDGLLTYSRIATKGATFETVDLNEIVKQLEQVELAELLEETGAAVEVPQPLPEVKAAPVQIRQLLQNLIINGIRYQREGIQPRIVIRAEQIADGQVRVEVEDNGIGIAKEYKDDVFKMFRRLHSRQKYEGTGIGLAVCKKIVERHNGQIGVESEAGAGSTFWFTLPVSEDSKAEQRELVSSLET